ncbi:unnamed protein product, partial [Iphiclides podalirius]
MAFPIATQLQSITGLAQGADFDRFQLAGGADLETRGISLIGLERAAAAPLTSLSADLSSHRPLIYDRPRRPSYKSSPCASALYQLEN